VRLPLGLLLCLFLTPSLAMAITPDPTQPESYRQPEVGSLVQRVNDAAAVVQQHGERAFPEFRKPGRWFQGEDDFYLFIFDLDGNQVLNAAFPEVEINRLEWRDAWGKPMFQLAIDKLSPERENQRFWWIHYLWPKPGETEASWKSTYMVRTQTPAGKVYIVAAGLYDLATEPLWIELLVQEAIDLIKRKGDEAFPIISSRSSQFMYRDTYVFVLNEHGVELATGAFRELIGKNLLAMPDFPRKQLIRDEIAFARKHGAGWMRGAWPRPGEVEPTQEQIYLQSFRKDGTLVIVGSGIYEPREVFEAD
jgi:cytochrome c